MKKLILMVTLFLGACLDIAAGQVDVLGMTPKSMKKSVKSVFPGLEGKNRYNYMTTLLTYLTQFEADFTYRKQALKTLNNASSWSEAATKLRRSEQTILDFLKHIGAITNSGKIKVSKAALNRMLKENNIGVQKAFYTALGDEFALLKNNIFVESRLRNYILGEVYDNFATYFPTRLVTDDVLSSSELAAIKEKIHKAWSAIGGTSG